MGIDFLMGFLVGLIAAHFANKAAYEDALNKKADALFSDDKEKNK